jgi:hypothetical protein
MYFNLFIIDAESRSAGQLSQWAFDGVLKPLLGLAGGFPASCRVKNTPTPQLTVMCCQPTRKSGCLNGCRNQ